MPSHLILRKKCIQKAWIWFLENGTNCPLLVIGNKSTYVVDKGWERILPMKAYNNFKLRNKTSYFFYKHCDINFKTSEKLPQCQTCTTLKKNCLS